jgi:lipopolysaccharide export system permease protein
MRLLDRYLLRELLVPLAYCLAGFLMLSIFSDLFASLNEFQSRKMVFRDVVEYYLVFTPQLLVLVLPVALLLALLYTLTNLARHHEITAMRAAGISLWRLCLPYFGVGLAAVAALFALNELCVPDSAAAAEAIKSRHMPRAPGTLPRNLFSQAGFVNFRAGRWWQFQLYNLDTSEMKYPRVIWKLADGTSRWLLADRALYTNGVWTFYNLRAYRADPVTNSYPVPFLQTNQLAFREFSETPEQINSDLRLTPAMSIMSSHKADVPIREIFNYLRLNPDPPRSDHDFLYTKLYGRIATPFTCIVVVLIAIPFGAASGRRNVFVGVASSLVICFVYFVLQQIGMTLGTRGGIAPWLAAWFPNLAFAIVGIWLTARAR